MLATHHRENYQASSPHLPQKKQKKRLLSLPLAFIPCIRENHLARSPKTKVGMDFIYELALIRQLTSHMINCILNIDKMNLLNVLSGLLTPLIAIIAACIAYQ